MQTVFLKLFKLSCSTLRQQFLPFGAIFVIKRKVVWVLKYCREALYKYQSIYNICMTLS